MSASKFELLCDYCYHQDLGAIKLVKIDGKTVSYGADDDGRFILSDESNTATYQIKMGEDHATIQENGKDFLPSLTVAQGEVGYWAEQTAAAIVAKKFTIRYTQPNKLVKASSANSIVDRANSCSVQ